MKNKGLVITVVIFVVAAFIGLIVYGAVKDHKKKSTPMLIMVEVINTTPENYFESKSKQTNINYKYDSVIHHAFLRGENTKWKTKYRFAYELTEGSGFDWDGYLKTHPEDAVDGGLHCHIIFSDNMPDIKYFNVR